MAYAATTTVPVAKSQYEIRALLEKHKADGIAILELWAEHAAMVQFAMKGRQLQFKLSVKCSIPYASEAKKEQFVRSRWRSLLLTIKAKLESVDSGIEIFDEAFMAQTVMPDGRTVGEHAIPNIKMAYEQNETLPLLSWGGQ